MNALRSVAIGMSAWLALSAFGATRVSADEGDPPTRVARLAFIEGAVSFQPGGTDAWVSPPINRPLTTGDQLWSDRGSRAELQLDGSSLRLSASTAVALLNISDNVTQIQLSSGTMLLHVRRLDDNETYEVDTPNLAFTVLRPGLYRLTVDGSGNSTAILVRRGQAEVSGGGRAYPVGADEYHVFSGTDELSENAQNYSPAEDAFEAWSTARDARWDHSESARYVSPDVVGYEDLDEQGTWTPDPEYGYIWFPRVVASGWAPYRNGHWAYISPWGYTWVDDSPWGFAPFHYGRWVSVRGAWAWIPAPPRRRDVLYVRPVYAPALVAWVGIGTGVAWCALGPREVYVPSYHVSQRYVNNINISNTNVNTTIVNNVYNTTIINKTVVNNTYVNRNVSGAVVATTAEAFASAQPVGRHAIHVDQRAIATAKVATFAPPTIPTKQAVLGSGRVSAAKPPAAVQTRPVVARTPAPAAPPAFERRQEAIKSNGGAPLSAAQVRQISAAAPTSANIRIAPPARMVAPAAAHAPAAMAPAPSSRPTEARIPPIAPNAIHPNELPPPRQPPSPAIANSVLERQHLQEQQQQHAQQEAERQRLQQQQEAEHQRAAQEAADRARQQELERQRQVQAQQQQRAQQEAQQQRAAQEAANRARQQDLERQHQVQTQQLAQQHAQEQQQMQARQQEQRRQQEAQPPPKPHKQDGSQKP
jgi:hypothetical protein